MPICKYTYIRNIEKLCGIHCLSTNSLLKNRFVTCATFLNVHFNEGLKVASWGTINSVYTTFPSVAYLHATTLDNNNVVTLIEFNKLWGCDGATFISFKSFISPFRDHHFMQYLFLMPNRPHYHLKFLKQYNLKNFDKENCFNRNLFFRNTLQNVYLIHRK